MHWTFGSFLWAMFVFFLWFVVIWMFISVFADILRRDMSGWAKAGWIVLIVFLPLIGILAYMIARPKTVEEYGAFASGGRHNRSEPVERSTADEIAKAARLYDGGKITADEYEALKHQALAV